MAVAIFWVSLWLEKLNSSWTH